MRVDHTWNSLHSKYNCIVSFALLLDNGALVDAKDENGWTRNDDDNAGWKIIEVKSNVNNDHELVFPNSPLESMTRKLLLLDGA